MFAVTASTQHCMGDCINCCKARMRNKRYPDRHRCLMPIILAPWRLRLWGSWSRPTWGSSSQTPSPNFNSGLTSSCILQLNMSLHQHLLLYSSQLEENLFWELPEIYVLPTWLTDCHTKECRLPSSLHRSYYFAISSLSLFQFQQYSPIL
jgi:hypothetical protein